MLNSPFTQNDDDAADTALAEELQALTLNQHHGALLAPIPLRASGRSLPKLNEETATPTHRYSPIIKLVGEYQQAVFLFSDLKNFDALSLSTPSHELVAKLNPIFNAFQSIIEEHGTPVGITTVKWESDCLMLCGSRDESSATPKYQVNAMLNIAHAFSQFTFAYNREVTGHSLDFTFGIHVGAASKTQVRLKESAGDDWFGETVNKASRMESSSHPYQAQVTEDVYHLAKKKFEFTEAHPRPIKSYGEIPTRFLIRPITASPKGLSNRANEGSSSSELPRKPILLAVPANHNEPRAVSSDRTPVHVRGHVKSHPALSRDDSTDLFSPQPSFLKSPKADPMIRIMRECKHAIFLFADIKGFSLLSKKISSCELVKQLDPIYTAFENIIEHHGALNGIQIVKWAGDCIMLCGNTAEETNEQISKQANTMIHIGYLLSKFMSNYNKQLEQETFDFRFGISMGKATQIRIRIKETDGKVKEHIDWFGEAVSKASKMESSSYPNQVQVTKELSDMTQDSFDFTEPLVREIKPYGEMTTRFLYGPSRKFSKELLRNDQQQSATSSKEHSRKPMGSPRSASSNK